MKNSLKIGLILLPIFILFGCEEMVSDVDAPVSPPKLVVTGFITPGMPYTAISVKKSRPLYTTIENYSEDFPTVKDAYVTISDGTDSAYLVYDIEFDNYRVSREELPIVPGRTYSLKVTAPGGFMVESSCTVPVDTPPDIEMVSIDTTSDYDILYLHANIRFKDLESEDNYYGITAGRVDWPEGQQNPVISEIGFERGEPYVSDKNMNNQYFPYSTYEFIYTPEETQRLFFTIAVTDIHYYNYHKSLYNYEGENPFAEPTKVYSNIKDGLGVFAAYILKGTAFDL